MLANILSAFSRKKTLTDDSVEKSELNRCLTIVDLTLLGVGSTLGLGVYVLAGAVAKSEAGPAVTISFLVAAVASAFAGKRCFLGIWERQSWESVPDAAPLHILTRRFAYFWM
jgi:L-asparagine transporter-like permease